jgi:hypothetical protein
VLCTGDTPKKASILPSQALLSRFVRHLGRASDKVRETGRVGASSALYLPRFRAGGGTGCCAGVQVFESALRIQYGSYETAGRHGVLGRTGAP